MADLNPFSKVLQKHAGRAKERLLQNFGKADRTTDEDFDFHVKNFSKQQNAALRLQKEFKNYHQCLKAMQAARRSLVETVNELYEPCWVGLDQFLIKTEVLNKNYDEFCDKINDELLSPVATHVSQFPDCTNKISKRNRKLLDYDNCRHNLQNLETMKRREESKISKAKEQLEDARNLFEVINTELHSELPAIYDSRVSFFVSHLRCLFITEAQFHNKDSTLLEEISGILESLEETYKKNPLPSFNEKSKNSDELEAKESHSSEKNYKEEDASSSSGSFVFSTPPTTADRNLNLEMLSEMSTVEELTEKEKIVPLKPKPQLVTFYKQEDSTDNALYMGENNVPFKSNSGTKQLVILNKIEDSPSSCRTYSLDSSVDGATALACSAFVDASSPDNVLYANENIEPRPMLVTLYKREDSPETAGGNTVAKRSPRKFKFLNRNRFIDLFKMQDSPSSRLSMDSPVDSSTALASITSILSSSPDNVISGGDKSFPSKVSRETEQLESLEKMEDSPSSCRTYTIESAVDSATSLTTSDSYPDSATSLTTSDSNPESDFFGTEKIVPLEPKPLLVSHDKVEDSPSSCHTYSIESAVDSTTSLTTSASSSDNVFGGKNTVPTKRNAGELHLMTLNKMLDSANAFACSGSVEASSPDKVLDGGKNTVPTKRNTGELQLMTLNKMLDSANAFACSDSVEASSPDKALDGEEKSSPKPEYKLRSIYNAGVDSPSLLDYPCSVDSTTSLDFPASVDTSCPDNVPYGDEKSDPVPENKLKTIYKIALDSPTSDNVLYRVKGTYKYTAEDVDELSFNVGDVIDVVAYDDPEEQEDGWLMGIFNGKKGLFPANFTSRI
ncbi:amphiphysin isoform X6 [Parasteatoda tepidariorum]|uniref:amphiphysin isoform X6 n=1 Tax=Parasteatoda tepidariorum TaxID=114398 RepID=UPI00077F8D59|nr:dynamin-binding protein isoform X5 [Parasteatoda tepidariorum]